MPVRHFCRLSVRSNSWITMKTSFSHFKPSERRLNPFGFGTLWVAVSRVPSMVRCVVRWTSISWRRSAWEHVRPILAAGGIHFTYWIGDRLVATALQKASDCGMLCFLFWSAVLQYRSGMEVWSTYRGWRTLVGPFIVAIPT